VAKLREPVLSNEEASSRFWIVDKDGLITKARSVDECIAFQSRVSDPDADPDMHGSALNLAAGSGSAY
jgi:hypothetical protein